MDFFEHQDQAKKKTKRLVFFFVLAVILIIATLNTAAFIAGNQSGQFKLTVQQYLVSLWFVGVTVATLVIILLGSLIRSLQISGGGHSVAKMVNARSIEMNTKDKLERRLINVVEEMSIASGMPVPSLFIMDEEMGMNAFVAGLVPSDTVLVVTKGLLENLNRQELQGVVAHEFSHIFNADMRMNVRLIAILGGILALGQLGYFLLRSMRYSRHRRSSSSNSNNNQLGMVIMGAAVVLLIVGYIGLFFGRLIKAAISRQREFLADASAVQYSRDSMGIANALYRIKTNGKGSLLQSSHAEDMSHMCFGTALKFTAFSNMLATHPPLDERIKTLVPHYRPDKSSDSESAPVYEDSAIAGFSSNQTAADSMEINSPEQLVAQIGQMQPEQLSQAKTIRESIPEQLIEAAHNTDLVILAILAIITAGSDGEIEQLLTSVSRRLTTNQLDLLKNYTQLAYNLPNKAVLPLVEIAMPSLKQLDDDQKKNMLACSSLLITADKKINPFEFFLYALLRKNLSQKDKGFSNSIFRKYKPVLEDIQYLISILAEASGCRTTELVGSAMASFAPSWKLPDTLPTYDASQLNKSLLRLNRLSPLLKKPLMQTLAEIVMYDGKLLSDEIDLLRATGIYLECPIPPLS